MWTILATCLILAYNSYLISPILKGKAISSDALEITLSIGQNSINRPHLILPLPIIHSNPWPSLKTQASLKSLTLTHSSLSFTISRAPISNTWPAGN
jgi:hypothetical protein